MGDKAYSCLFVTLLEHAFGSHTLEGFKQSNVTTGVKSIDLLAPYAFSNCGPLPVGTHPFVVSFFYIDDIEKDKTLGRYL